MLLVVYFVVFENDFHPVHTIVEQMVSEERVWHKISRAEVISNSMLRLMIGQTDHIWMAFKELFGGSKT